MPNQAKKYIGVKAADTLRAAVENQGKWVYYLTMEGIDSGLSTQFAKDAMQELGEYYAEHEYSECNCVEKFVNQLMNRSMEMGQEAIVENKSDAGFDLKIGYCPMLNMWEQLTEDGEKIRDLCDVACSMFKGLAAKKGMNVEKQSAIAKGDDHCVFCFRKDDSV